MTLRAFSTCFLEPDNAARVTLFFFCLVGFERCLSFVGWLLVLWVSPSRALET